jgi:uncharacterized Rossmann fold enzyme
MSVPFSEWEPVYERILASFGFRREADERARDLLARELEGSEVYDPERLDWHGRTVAVAGGGPNLGESLDLVREADIVVAASTAVDRLQSEGFAVDCMVTDLDKNPETVERLTGSGVPVAVHAHGDNIPAVRSLFPAADPAYVIPTTQARPVDGVYNFGGFTDGDRAAFLADSAGAAALTFPGWDFDDPSVSDRKAKKLRWAERLLYWLERRRGEEFEVLGGRREAIETDQLPVE